MANLFDSSGSPTTEPLQIVVGDYIQWRRTDLSVDYDNSLYTMTYVMQNTDGSSNEFKVIGSAYGEDYLFLISSSSSAIFSSGKYKWQLEAKRNSDSQRIVIDRGFIDVIQDLDLNGVDIRSHAEIMVSKLQSLLEGKADSDVADYEIAGRKLTKLSFREVLSALQYYKGLVNIERQNEAIKAGKPSNSTVKARF